MLAGARLFSGETASETLASVIKDDSSFERVPAATPPHIRRLLRRCLTKDPRERLQAIGEARIAIDRPEPEARVASDKRVGLSPWTAALALAVAAIIAGVATWSSTSEDPRRLVRVVATPPSSEPVSVDSPDGDVAITPDGSRIVYSVSRDGRR